MLADAKVRLSGGGGGNPRGAARLRLEARIDLAEEQVELPVGLLACHVAVIEQATTPLQNIYTSNIYNFSHNYKGQQFVSPSLVIIGKVVTLNEQFNWIANSNSKEYYFNPVASLNNKIDSNNNNKKNVNRA